MNGEGSSGANNIDNEGDRFRYRNQSLLRPCQGRTFTTLIPRKRKCSFREEDQRVEVSYSRSHLHRSCKLVIRETGQCLFEIQRELSAIPLPNEKKKKRPKKLPKLPPEIWIKIFSYITQERQYPFMINAPFVCKQWYDLCLAPSLWTYVKVPYGGYYWMRRTDNFLIWLAKNRLAPCKEIDLTGWDITSTAIQELAENCPRLRVINLSYCTKLSRDVATHLTRNCPHIQSVDFSHSCNDLVSVSPMTTLIESYNSQLVSINLSGNLLHGFNGVFDAICENCPNLEIFSVNYCRVDVISLDIERLQRSLLHLRTLNMGYLLAASVNITEKPSYLSPGFRSLEDLSIAVGSPCDNRHPLPVNDNFIERMTLASRQLKSLDLRGAEHFTLRTLLKIPCPDLEKLQLGIRIIDNPDGLVELIKMWQHSLTDLVLSYNCFTAAEVTNSIYYLVSKENPLLERIELENVDIEMPVVKAICENCPNLRCVNLQKCMLLPKKLRRFFDRFKIHHFRRLVEYFSKHKNIT